MNPDALEFSFVRSEMRTLLGCLLREELRLQEIVSVSEDEIEITDAVNGLAEVRLLLDRLRKPAVEKYGPGVARFDFDLR